MNVASKFSMATALTIACLAPLRSHGQVPDGWIVVSSFKAVNIPTPQAPFPGNGGIWLVDPTNPGPPIPVTGLGSDLTGAGVFPSSDHGANSVLRRRSDGALIVGELVGPGQQVDLHVLTLSGSIVPPGADVTYACGIAGSQWGQVAQCAFLPSGNIMMAVGGIVSGPLAGERLGILDLLTGTFTAIPVPSIPGEIHGLAIDPSMSVAYIGAFIGSGAAGFGMLWSLTLSGGGLPTDSPNLVQNLPGGVMNLAIDNDGQVIAACFGTDVFKINPLTAAITAVGLTPDIHNTVTVERVTGTYLVNKNDLSGLQPSVWLSRVAAGPTATQLLIPPTNGWGYPSGLDINHDPEAYGSPSPGSNSYAWVLAPNPSGLPIAGNQGFSVTLRGSPYCAPGFLGASLAPLSPPVAVAGILLNVDVFSVQSLLLMPIPCTSLNDVVLPIPLPLGTSGIRVFLQTAHLDPQGSAASPGLELTVL